MSDAELSKALRAFLRDHIESCDQLEILLFLKRSHEQWWTASTIKALSLGQDDAVEASLDLLVRHDLAEVRGSVHAALEYRYAPKNSGITDVIDEIVSAFANRPLEVVKVITAGALERLRTTSLHVYPWAFSAQRKGSRHGLD